MNGWEELPPIHFSRSRRDVAWMALPGQTLRCIRFAEPAGCGVDGMPRQNAEPFVFAEPPVGSTRPHPLPLPRRGERDRKMNGWEGSTHSFFAKPGMRRGWPPRTERFAPFVFAEPEDVAWMACPGQNASLHSFRGTGGMWRSDGHPLPLLGRRKRSKRNGGTSSTHSSFRRSRRDVKSPAMRRGEAATEPHARGC